MTLLITILTTVLATLLVLNVLIFVHESGHYWAARLCQVEVLRFSVGFGPRLWGWRGRTGTRYILAAVPLGGYVQLFDTRIMSVPEELMPFTMQGRPLVQRMFIAAAGPAANFLLALLILWGLLLFGGERGMVPRVAAVSEDSLAYQAGIVPGQRMIALNGRSVDTLRELNIAFLRQLGTRDPWRLTVRDEAGESSVHSMYWTPADDAQEQQFLDDPLGTLGISPQLPPILPVVGAVTANGAGARAGLRSGDRLLSVDGTALHLWSDVAAYIRPRPEQQLVFSVERDGIQQLLNITPDRVSQGGEELGFLGVEVQKPELPPEFLVEKHYSVAGSFVMAAHRTWDFSLLILNFLWKMVCGQVSSRHLGGPVAIGHAASISVAGGIVMLLTFTALLSINLGVLNLLPIPILDGGVLVLHALEGLRGRPLGKRAEMFFVILGLVLLGLVLARALYNDVLLLLGWLV